MQEEKDAVQAAIDSLKESLEAAPDFRKIQAIEHLEQALHALDQHVDKIPEGKPVADVG